MGLFEDRTRLELILRCTLSEVVSPARRIAAVVAILALGAGKVGVCAGWQATPEARMACCMSGASCPMHKSEGHDHSSKNGVSQAQADSCCAASAQRTESTSPGSTFAASGVIALMPAAVFSSPMTVLSAQEWRAPVPPLVSSVPKHLLLSVFLV
ncbi:MAG TPA: hypothetical protein VKE51_19875 [Vicinamibacterales bacterium]|nr:hypothetical protein [Vicinamibacterales bacterium]